MEKFRCPFVYARGRKCTGHIVRVEAYKADVRWSPAADGRWEISIGEPRSHYHLFCSEKGNHAGWGRSDADSLKCFWKDLPEPLQRVVRAKTVNFELSTR